jgi:hypothetical protein
MPIKTSSRAPGNFQHWPMNSPIGVVVAALILGVALVVAGFLAGGRYAVSVVQGTGNMGGGNLVYEVDRFTGAISTCLFTGEKPDAALQCFRSNGHPPTMSDDKKP